MTNTTEDFISTFNECYPFERYILKEPKPINLLFDDVVLTEIFVPYTEIKPILNDGHFIGHTSVNDNEIYVKVKGASGEMRFGLYDFCESVRGDIVDIVIGDMGEYEYESLYVDHEDGEPDLVEMLENQKSMIIEKYGECKIKNALRDNLV